jgi:hypothetical protein
MGQSLSGICQDYHTVTRDYGTKFVKNMSWLPQGDTWLCGKVCQEYIRATTRWYVIMGQSFSGICQGYHTVIRDYGARFFRNMLGLPQGDRWLWSKVCQEYVRATIWWYVIMGKSLSEICQATTVWYVIMGQSLSGICQDCHRVISDYGATFVRNMSVLPQGDTWL